jgi:hypothetical protein
MSELAVGVTLVSGAGAAALLLAFFGRNRLSRGFVFFVLALCGAGIGLGIGLVLGEETVPQLVAAVILLSVLTPFHARVVFGPFGQTS